MEEFAAIAIALYVGHHVGDYWVQTDHQARNKGKHGHAGRSACLMHVMNYVTTQIGMLLLLSVVLDWHAPMWKVSAGLLVSGVTHYLADRREYGLMFKIARMIPGLSGFMKLGAPRADVRIEVWDDCETCKGTGSAHDESTGGKCWDCQGGGQLPHWIGDNPQLATGTWALDQSWHIFWGVFVAALIIAA